MSAMKDLGNFTANFVHSQVWLRAPKNVSEAAGLDFPSDYYDASLDKELLAGSVNRVVRSLDETDLSEGVWRLPLVTIEGGFSRFVRWCRGFSGVA